MTDTIVKVQRPIASNEPKEHWLIYDKPKDVHVMVEPNDDLRGMMGISYKKYFKAEISEEGMLILGDEVTEQEAGF